MFLGLGKLAGAGKEIAVAYRYGTSNHADLYVLAVSLVAWLPSVWMSVSISVLVPLTHRLNDDQRLLFHRELKAVLIVVGLLLGVATWYALPSFLTLFSPEFLIGNQAEFARLNLIISISVPCLIVTSFFNAQLLSVEKHSNTLLNGIPSLTLMLTLVLFPYFDNTDSLSIGFLLGSVLHLLVLVFLVRSLTFNGTPKFSFTSTGWRSFADALSIMMISNLIISIAPIADQLIASRLSEGSVATLGYSIRLTALFLGLGATAIARAILPILSRETSEAQKRSITIKWFTILLFGGVLFAILAWLVAPMLVSGMFQRGQFDAQDSVTVTHTLRHGLLQVPFYFSGIVLVQYFTSQRRYLILFVSSCIALLVKLTLGFYFAERMGTAGITLSTGFMYIATFTFLLSKFFNDKERATA